MSDLLHQHLMNRNACKLSLDVVELLLSLLLPLSISVLIYCRNEAGLPCVGEEADGEPEGDGVGTEEVRDWSCHFFVFLTFIL